MNLPFHPVTSFLLRYTSWQHLLKRPHKEDINTNVPLLEISDGPPSLPPSILSLDTLEALDLC